MHDLSRNIVRVMRYERFLERLNKQNEECGKGDFVSQECASVEEFNISNFTAREATASCDSSQFGSGDMLAAPDPYATQRAPSFIREEQVIEDKNNNTLAGGTSSSCQVTAPEQISSSWDTLSCTQIVREPQSVNADGCQFSQGLSVNKENCAINMNECGATAGPLQNYRSAGEFFATFRGFDDISEFPTNFLEEEKKPGSAEDLKFKDGVTVTISGARDSLLDGALMNGDVASFYIVHYIPHAMLPNDWPKRSKVYFANTDLYPMISRKCRNKLIQQSGGEITAETVREVFLSRKGTVPLYLVKLVEAELSVIPIIWENHWLEQIVFF
ncbi:hypothetical protein OSTOST_19669, partial [Ostertagia ostertagi]